MSVDLQVDQVLILKKRARRRLVGAIALVLLMLIILPQILQDRSAQSAPEAIKITMPEPEETQVNLQNEQPLIVPDSNIVEVNQPAEAPQVLTEIEPTETPSTDTVASLKKAEIKETEQRKSLVKEVESKANPVSVSKNETKKVEPVAVVKPVEKPPVLSADSVLKAGEDKIPPKSEGSFTVQVGVYSDVANVKRLQDQLKEAGFVTTTEKASTPKGDGLRLKAGKFTSRQDATNALMKIKEIGLSGIVISND